MLLYLCCFEITDCHTDVFVSLYACLLEGRSCDVSLKRTESAEPHEDGLLNHRHIYTNPKQKGSNLKIKNSLCFSVIFFYKNFKSMYKSLRFL